MKTACVNSVDETVGTFATVPNEVCSKCGSLCALCVKLTTDFFLCPSCVYLLAAVLLEGPKDHSEIWKPIPGFTSYEVSSIGRIRSWKIKGSHNNRRSSKPWLLKTPRAATGYLMVCLSFPNGEQRSLPVHRLVALAFLGDPKQGEVCRHLNDAKLDNHFSNLAWGTQRENVLDAVRNGTRTGERSSGSKLTKQQVLEILDSKEDAKTLGKRYHVNFHTIYDIRLGKTWKEIPRAQ